MQPQRVPQVIHPEPLCRMLDMSNNTHDHLDRCVCITRWAVGTSEFEAYYLLVRVRRIDNHSGSSLD